ncbi:HAMP domain-containing histidine kinase, partial [Mesorhizobium sp. M2D.F.Ca.ET.160.01.1.1]
FRRGFRTRGRSGRNARIFDPFVTTKASGIGLGLAICRMIVEQHGGHLLASSERDQGARFEVVLPTLPA